MINQSSRKTAILRLTSQPSGEYHNTFDITAKWGIPQYYKEHIGTIGDYEVI
jgi:hypothetical protein